MQAYIIRRVVGGAIVIFMVGTFVFFMMRVLPGDPAAAALGLDAGSTSSEALEARRAELGLDKPILRQYGDWLWSAVQLDLGQTYGYHGWTSIILPSFAVGLASAGRLAQMMRRAIVEELRQPYAVTAQSRGFSRSYTIAHHVFRNVASTFVTFTGWEMTRMFTGYTVVIEVVFAWPGMGKTALDAIEQKDLILVQAAVVVLAGLVVFTNLAIDVVRRFIDPRVELL